MRISIKKLFFRGLGVLDSLAGRFRLKPRCICRLDTNLTKHMGNTVLFSLSSRDYTRLRETGLHVCEIRNCAMAKDNLNCGECDVYPCGKISKFHEMVPEAKITLDVIHEERKK